ncbi:MAG: Maf family protein [Beijerinckiaceae bacterium]
MNTSLPAWPWLAPAPLILASGSATRAGMLRAALLPFEQVLPSIDERAIDEPLRAAGVVAADRALALARTKALAVAQLNRDSIVIGADQTLDALGHPGFKAETTAEARQYLLKLCGRAHRLHSAAAVARDGVIMFACVESATLTVRRCGEDFIDAYLAKAGQHSLSSVGGYRIEGEGVHLFDAIDGDHNVILGLPLLPVLAYLRRVGALAA